MRFPETYLESSLTKSSSSKSPSRQNEQLWQLLSTRLHLIKNGHQGETIKKSKHLTPTRAEDFPQK